MSEESKIIDSSDFVQINKWMFKLGLKTNDLLVFAIINSYSRDNETCFKGSIGYISRLTNVTRPTIHKSLNTLVEMGLISRIENIINGVSLPMYKRNLQGVEDLIRSKEILQGSKKILHPPCKEFLHHNNSSNKSSNKNSIESKDKSLPNPQNFSDENPIDSEPTATPPQVALTPPKFNFKAKLIEIGVKEQIAKDWMEVRKKSRAANTETALNAILAELRFAWADGHKPNECIEMAVVNNWRGFKYEWMKNKINYGKTNRGAATDNSRGEIDPTAWGEHQRERIMQEWHDAQRPNSNATVQPEPPITYDPTAPHGGFVISNSDPRIAKK